VLSIVLPCAVFNAEALRMVEIHRLNVFLVNLKAKPGVVLFDFQQRGQCPGGGVRRDEQRADEAGLHHADKAF
jgi:hypothetical protein